MVEEGREWHTVTLYPAVPLSSVPLDRVSDFYQGLMKTGSCYAFPHEYFIKGDTVINNKSYKKLITNELTRNYLAALRQENNRVYAVFEQTTQEYVLFDFGLKVGDIVKDPFEAGMMRVEQVDTVLVDGKECRRLYMWAYYDNEETVNGLVDIWVEGIGCMSGPAFTFQWTAIGGSSLLLSCYQDNRQLVITENTSGMKFAGLSAVPDKAPVYDLQGRRLNRQPAKGVYIQDGKKRVR